MMEQRQQGGSVEEQAQTTEEEIAAAIAALLGDIVAVQTVEALVGAIASLLARLPGLPESDGDDSVTRRVARLVVEGRPAFREGTSSATLRSTHVDNLIHRAHYAINATKRVIQSDDTRKAFTQERRHFMAHRDAERRRTAGARMVDAAIELHGPMLGWRHGHPREPRPTHKAADGRNFDARTIPRSTGALPGVLPNCTCTITAPFPKAEVLR